MTADLRIAAALIVSCFPVGFALGMAAPATPAPEPAWVTTAKVVNVVDGDTIDVEITKVIRVRMLDCWAPESRIDARIAESQRETEKARGLAAKQALQELAGGQDVLVQIPTDTGGEVAHMMTLNRVLGRVWIASDLAESLSEKQVKAGHATATKPEGLQ